MFNKIFISPDGNDSDIGTEKLPLKSLNMALRKIRERKKNLVPPSNGRTDLPDGGISVILRDGYYFLDNPLVLDEQYSGEKDKPIVFQAYKGEKPIISGGIQLELEWTPFRDGIFQSKVSGDFPIDCLFVNGKLQNLARYPNYDSDAKFFHGTSPDTINPERVKGWKNPIGGYIHALHQHLWGSKHYQIIGADKDGNLKLKGGWQENRGGDPNNPEFVGGYHKEFLFVENIFEELDAPGEWFFDSETRTLYLIPEDGVNLNDAHIIAAFRKQLFIIKGSLENPVRYLQFRDLNFKYGGHVFMENYERVTRGDWSIARQGAVFFENTEHCLIQDCTFADLGGNAVFISDYNRHIDIKCCLFENLGESAICFLGNDKAVRSGAIRYENNIPLDQIDRTPKPKSTEYPAFCNVEDNLIRKVGMIGKQTAGVFISKSQDIIISHNTIYDIPRAGICINDSTWGGHVIEFNDVFDTVKESGDHGPFNSWGRDRHWQSSHGGGFDKGDQSHARADSRLDTDRPVIIRNNRWKHRSGFSWGIDLDDGTSNYQLYNNLCLGCSYKLREGFYRLVENNICIGPNPPGKHCCYKENQDVIRRNIIVNTGDTIMWHGIHHQPNQTKQIDYQLFWTSNGKPPTFINAGQKLADYKEIMTLEEWQSMGHDVHSVFADPMFIDPAKEDYRVRPDSPALKLGFKNFPMDQFGVRKTEFLMMMVSDRTDQRNGYSSMSGDRDKAIHIWQGAKIRNLAGWEEMSATGIGQESGVILLETPENSDVYKIGFKAGDVILSINGQSVNTVQDFLKLMKKYAGKEVICHVVGNPPPRDVMFVITE